MAKMQGDDQHFKEETEFKYNVFYGIYCYLIVCMIFNCKQWCNLAIGQVYGYTSAEHATDKDYIMTLAIPDFDKDAYAQYNSLFVIGYLPVLMFVSPPLADFNKKLNLGIACIGWGLATFAHSFATSASALYVLVVIIGLCQGSIEASLYSEVGRFFAPQHRQRAYVLYSFIGLLQEPMKFAIGGLIGAFGWKAAWQIVGGVTMAMGTLFLVTCFEPNEGAVTAKC